MRFRGLFHALCALSLPIVLSACATQMDEEAPFNASNPEGMVVVGVSSQVGPYEFFFAQFDPATCRIVNPIAGSKKFDNTQKRDAGVKHYIADTFKPGFWVVHAFSYKASYTQPVFVDLSQGALAFEVRPGRMLYLGDVALTSAGPRHRGFDLPGLNNFLTRFTRLDAPPESGVNWVTPLAKRGEARAPGCVSAPRPATPSA